jgi:ABC-type amino acid transport substrate-binding protein
MADRVLFIGWSNAARGREAAAAGVFAESIAYFGSLQAAGDIEGFDVVLLDAHGGDLGGFFLLKGEREKLMRARATDEMERHMLRANLVVDDLGAVGGALGEGVTRQMAKWQEAAKELA